MLWGGKWGKLKGGDMFLHLTVVGWRVIFEMGVVPLGPMGQVEFEREPDAEPGTKYTHNVS